MSMSNEEKLTIYFKTALEDEKAFDDLYFICREIFHIGVYYNHRIVLEELSGGSMGNLINNMLKGSYRSNDEFLTMDSEGNFRSMSGYAVFWEYLEERINDVVELVCSRAINVDYTSINQVLESDVMTDEMLLKIETYEKEKEYTFDELPEDIQEKVVEEEGYYELEHFDYTVFETCFKEQLHEKYFLTNIDYDYDFDSYSYNSVKLWGVIGNDGIKNIIDNKLLILPGDLHSKYLKFKDNYYMDLHVNDWIEIYVEHYIEEDDMLYEEAEEFLEDLTEFMRENIRDYLNEVVYGLIKWYKDWMEYITSFENIKDRFSDGWEKFNIYGERL